jgi:hypothetical protein
MKRLTWILLIVIVLLFWLLLFTGCSEKINDKRIKKKYAPVKMHNPSMGRKSVDDPSRSYTNPNL